MKIIYIHQYFKTPKEGGAIRSYYIAKALVEAGCRVEMITSHNSRNYIQKNIEGISVHYLPVFYDNKFGFYKRIFAFLGFIILACKKASALRGDVSYATSTPLTVGVVALWLKFRHKTPFFFEVRDLWPEAPGKLGFLKNPLLLKLSQRLERKIYHQAEKIICLSPGIENNIKKRFLYLKTVRVPNMSDCRYFQPEEKHDSLLKKFNVQRKDLVVSYFGALGKINHLDYLLAAAQTCQKRNLPVKFFVAGKGATELRLKKLAQKLHLRNLRFLGHLAKDEIRELLNVSDAGYISFLPNKILETNSPNKFFDALAAGKMIITNSQGWIKDLIDEHNCGFYANPEMPEEFADKIFAYIENRELLEAAKLNSRKLAESKFSRDELTKVIVNEFVPAGSETTAQSSGL